MVCAADPFSEGLLELVRSQGRPTGAGYAGRLRRSWTPGQLEKIWLVIRGGGGGVAELMLLESGCCLRRREAGLTCENRWSWDGI